MNPAVETPAADTQAIFETNFFGATRTIDVFLPLLLQAKGTIGNVGSVVSFMPMPWVSMYSASKAALKAYTRTLRLELAPLGVNVMYLETAGVNSNAMAPKARRQLKEGSLYEPLGDRLVRRQEEAFGEGIPASEYAKQVVSSVIRPGGWIVWAGHLSTPVRFVNWLHNLFPGNLWGFMIARMMGFANVKLGNNLARD